MFHGLTSSNLFLLCIAVAAWGCVFSVPLGVSRGGLWVGLWVSDGVMSRGGLWVSDGVVEHHSQQRVAVIYLPLVQTSLFTHFLQFQILEYTKLDKINCSLFTQFQILEYTKLNVHDIYSISVHSIVSNSRYHS